MQKDDDEAFLREYSHRAARSQHQLFAIQRTEEADLFGGVEVELHGARRTVARVQEDTEGLHDGDGAGAYNKEAEKHALKMLVTGQVN